MRLSKAIGIGRGDVVALVGAGGKSTAMFRLAGELTSDGWKVITTTTTMVRRDQRSEHTILEPDGKTLLEKARASLRERSHITVASELREAEGKLAGVDPLLVDDLVALPEVDAVIVEADGAKGRSLKAPAAHEPVMPASTTILVPVAAVDAVAKPLDEKAVYRPKMVAGLADLELGQPITPQTIASVLVHPEGGMKNVPPQARVIPLINKVTEGQLQSAREIAQLLLEEPRVHRVLLGSVAEQDPIEEAWGRMAVIVLAAGESRRFGSPKQLLPWGEATMLEHVVDTALESAVDETIVVLGHRAERIGKLLRNRPVRVVINQDWQGGLSTSVRAGLQALPANYEACLFLLGDQPNVTPQLIDTILKRYRRTLAPVVAPSYRGRRGNPVLFSNSLFPELLTMEGDQGGREVIRRHQDEMETVEAEQEDLFLDIDTVADYEGAR
ncbi:MAG: molybdenum cofactor cytidylyltransferase [Chloroflexi bacterium B3_Chlor]|nr:MAG: molybdenum cofactor cytidylyltransferase [Chloroflexi bacterium B3_Chlor]